MGWIEKFAQYGAQRGVALENAIKETRDALDANTYTADDFVRGNLKLWFDTMDGWCDLFPSVAPTPTLVALLGQNQSPWDGFVAVARLKSNTVVLSTALIALKGSATGTVTPTLQPDGTLKLHVVLTGARAPGDLYESFCYWNDTVLGKRPLVAVLRLTIA